MVPTPTAVGDINAPSFGLPAGAVKIPVKVAPELLPCIFTLPPESLILVASIPVKFAPLIAGSAPVSFDAVSVDILASATVPVKLPAGILVKFAPEPENVVAVITPAFPILILLPTSN